MALVKVKRHHQITLPHLLRKKLNLDVGDYVEIEDRGGEIVIKPVKMVHPDQVYFYTKEWQKGEAEADKDIAKGDVLGPFDTADECIQALKNTKA
jgi:antitoxin MazE